MKCTNASSARIWREVAKAGRNAYHVFDYDTQEAVIMESDQLIPISERITVLFPARPTPAPPPA